MNISLPDELRTFVDGQVRRGRYTSTSEYVRDLIRREQDRERLRDLLLDGVASPEVADVDAAYFEALRERVRGRDA